MDPIFIAIASAVVGKTTEAAFKGGAKVVDLVKQRFSKDDAADLVLLRAEKGRASKQDLAEAIAKVCAEDAEFRTALEGLIGQPIPVQQTQINAQFYNDFKGPVGNVVQVDRIDHLEM